MEEEALERLDYFVKCFLKECVTKLRVWNRVEKEEQTDVSEVQYKNTEGNREEIDIYVRAGINIFISFQNQFINIVEKKWENTMLNLSKSAVSKITNCIDVNENISVDLITKCLVSEKSANGNIEESNNAIDIWEKVGLATLMNDGKGFQNFFTKANGCSDTFNLGYRLPLSWEMKNECEIMENVIDKYEVEKPNKIQKLYILFDTTNMNDKANGLINEIMSEMARSEKNYSTNKNINFNRRVGNSGISGQLYEIALLMLLLLESFIKRKKVKDYTFYLTTNAEEGGNFDDVIYRNGYKNENNEAESQIFFLQAKHKSLKDDKLTLELLLSDSEKEFALKKYFGTFRQIKRYFSEKKDHAIFSGNFEKCDFIIYTNASLVIKKKDENFTKMNILKDCMLFLEDGYLYHKLSPANKTIQAKLMDVLEYTSTCKKIAKDLTASILSSKGIDMSKGNMKHYYLHMTNNVIEILQPDKATFRDEFLNNNLSQFTRTLFEEMQKNKKYDGRTVEDIKLELQKYPIKLLNAFGNAPRSQNNLEIPQDLINEEEVKEFINKLQLFTGQPNEEKLCENIKIKIKNTFPIASNEAGTIFSQIKSKVEKWWKDGTHYLTQNNTIIQDTVRVSIRFNIKESVELFTGRKEELESLHQIMQSTPVTVISQVTSICGLGGVGKTELAREYIGHYHTFYDGNIIWINAESEQTCTESFRRVAKERLELNTKNIDGKEKDIRSTLDEVYNFFNNRESLFVFDNAEKSEVCKKFIPSSLVGIKKPHILLTSRNQEWENRFTVFKLEVMKLEDAVEFVKRGLSISRDDITQNTEIKQLVTTLQCFPLAIQQAIAYISDQKEYKEYAINDYLREFENQSALLLDNKEYRGLDNGYAKTTFTTWKVTTDKIKSIKQYGELAIDILNIISYCAPNNIKREIFLNISENNITNLKMAVRLLIKYSMVNGEERQSVLHIHRLVQEVTRLELKESGLEESILKKGLNLINGKLQSENVDHGINVWNYATKYEILIKEFTNMPSKVVSILNECVRLEEAYIFGINALKAIENILDEDNLDISSLNHNIANVLESQGKFKEALALFDKVNKKITTILEENHPDVLTTQHNIAKMLENLGHYTDALEAYENILKRKTQALGPLHQETLLTKHNIAGTLGKLGKYKEALKIYREIFYIKNKLLGADHPSTLIVKQNIAVILESSGDQNMALEAYRDIIEIKKDVLGDKHLSTLTTKHNAAGLLEIQGNFGEAHQLYEEVLQVRKKLLGPYHRDTLATENNIAMVLIRQGEYKKALICFEEIFEKMSTTLGSDHPDSLSTKNNKGVVLEKLGRYDEALDVYRYVIDQRIFILGKNHPDTLITKHNLATVLENLGKHNEALEQMEEILMLKRESLDENHPSILTTRNNIAGVLESLERYNDAYELFEDVLNRRAETLGPDNPDTLTTKNNLALVLVRLGKHEEALKMYQEILVKQINQLNPHHNDCVTTKHNIAGVLGCMGEKEAALLMYKEVLEAKKKNFNELHPEVLHTQHNIAGLLKQLGNLDEALINYKDVFNKRKIILGTNHPDTLITLRFTAEVLESQEKYEEALDKYMLLLNIQTLSGEENMSTLAAKNSIAKMNKHLGNYKMALELYEEVYSKLSSIFTPDHEVPLLVLHNIASVLECLQKYTEALRVFREVLRKRSEILDPNNDDILSTKSCIEKLEKLNIK